MYLYNFEKLEIWILSKEFILNIYRISKCFPTHEKYGLRSQINRAVISIASNIAEGSSRKSFNDQARFVEMAYSSLIEVIAQIEISYSLEYLSTENYQEIRRKSEKLSNKINAYYKYLKRTNSN